MSKTKYPGLDKSVNLKIRHELIDFDYLHKLSEKDKLWLSTFMREYVSADFRHLGKKLNKGKKVVKAIYDANNARNRDSFSVTKSNGMLKGMNGSDLGREDNKNTGKELGMSSSKTTLANPTEDALIEVLDFINSNKLK
jgi:hypothetical protein